MRVRFALNLKGGGERSTSAMYAADARFDPGNTFPDAALCKWTISSSLII